MLSGKRYSRFKVPISAYILIFLLASASISFAQANQLPVLDPIGSKNVDEGINLNFSVTSSDVESTPVLTTSTLPTGASFVDSGNGAGSFDWTPDFTQSGPYSVTF